MVELHPLGDFHDSSCVCLECIPLAMPDYGRFLEGYIMLPQHPGSNLTPVCEEGFTKALGFPKTLTCKLWGKWVDDKQTEIEVSEWEKKRLQICQGKLSHLSATCAWIHLSDCLPVCISIKQLHV